MTLNLFEQEEQKVGKQLYDYQQEAMDKIFQRLREFPDNYNLLFQLPTGGGKTVIFSEIAKHYIKENKKKVIILTHRIELCSQTSHMLSEMGVKNKVINSKVKELPDKNQFTCFVAMVETLNNRLQDEVMDFSDVGLVIIDEAHINSFRKLFKYFDKKIMLGVTATPLSSNIDLPMKDHYHELIVGHSISELIERNFLAKATTFTFNVGLTSLKIGVNGDYTVSSSEQLYNSYSMQDKLLHAYEQRAKGKKTLIFNNGINTSRHVHDLFVQAGYDVRHLDNTNSEQERKDTLEWFKNKPDAILSSVSILTTGFDEPTVECIILNRATRSLTLYHQMIGRGSRILPNKSDFAVIDLGNNALRFGLWDSYLNWHDIFRAPNHFIESIQADSELEFNFTYEMPEDIRKNFPNSESIEFDIKEEYVRVTREGLRPKIVIERSIKQHTKILVENSEDVFSARQLAKLLEDDIEDRIRRYSYCICKSTKNYVKWLEEDYKRKLSLSLQQQY